MERLIKEVVMDPFGQRAAIVNVPRGRIGHPVAVRWNPSLKDQPFGVSRQVINSGGWHPVSLVHDAGVDGDWFPEKLRNVGAVQCTQEISSEDSSRGDVPIGDRAMKCRDTVQIVD